MRTTSSVRPPRTLRAVALAVVVASALIVSAVVTAPPARAARTAIRGTAAATVEQAQDWARSKRATQQFIDLAPLYWSLSPVRGGVRADIAYVQAAVETGWGRFGGVIDATYNNPCGLKTRTGGSNTDPNAHNRFASWEQGVTACIDHLALYAGSPGYPRADTPDPRHFTSITGVAPTVEDLSQRWATSATYGAQILNLLGQLVGGPYGSWRLRTTDTGEGRGPAAPVVSPDGALHTFADTAGTGVRHDFATVPSLPWPSEVLDPTGATGESPATIVYANQLHVFTGWTGGAGVRHMWFDYGLWQWFYETLDAGGALGGGTSTAVYAGQLHVFAKPSVGTGLRHLWWDPTTARWWSETLDVDGSVVSTTSVIETYGQLHVFTSAADAWLRHTFWDPASASWGAETLRGGPVGADTAAVNYGPQLRIIGPPATGVGIATIYYSPEFAAWVPEPHGTGASDAASGATVVVGLGQLHFFARAASGPGMRHHWWDPTTGAWWDETLDASTELAGDVTSMTDGRDVHTFARTSTNALRNVAFEFSY